MEKSNLFEFEIDHEGREELTDLSRWTKVQAIVVLAIISLLGLTVIFSWTRISIIFAISHSFSGNGGPFTAVAIIILLAFVVIGVMMFFLLRASKRIRAGVGVKDHQLLNAGLGDLKTYFAIFGVISLLILAINIFNFF